MEFELYNKITGKTTFRYANSYIPNWQGWKLNEAEWEVVFIDELYSEFHEM